jgi:hypothetical protein
MDVEILLKSEKIWDSIWTIRGLKTTGKTKGLKKKTSHNIS